MPNITILLAGVLGVGKTTIFKRIETGEFVQCPSPAVVSKSDLEAKHFIYTDNIEGKDYKVTLWDTGGLEKYHSMTSNYFRYCHAVILVYDSSPEKIHTLFALREWIEQTKSSSFLRDRVIFSLWENKIDTHTDDTTTRPPEVDAFLQEHSIPESLHYSVSARTGENLMESFQNFIVHVNNTLTESKATGSGSIALSDPEEVDGIENSPTDSDARPWHRRICSKC